MTNIKIQQGNLTDFDRIYQRFTKDFAPDELKSYAHLQLLLKKKRYKLLLAKDIELNEIVGYAFIYEIDRLGSIWLDYIAIFQEYRNSGYGSRFFKEISQSRRKNNLGIFLEVEIPEEREGNIREKQIKRIKFYERLGAIPFPFPYEFPTSVGGFPMFLYFRPGIGIECLPEKLIKKAIEEAYENIHFDINNKERILNRIFPSITDFYIEQGN